MLSIGMLAIFDSETLIQNMVDSHIFNTFMSDNNKTIGMILIKT